MLIDFEYDGKKLSDFGMIVSTLDGTVESMNIGNNISDSDVKAPGTDEYLSIGMDYSEKLVANIKIFNFNCDKKNDFQTLDEITINKLMRWLNRRGYYKFKPIYEDGSYSDVYFKGTFNVELIMNGSNVIGLDLTLNTNAPYGFRDIDKFEFSFNGGGDNVYYDELIANLTDEISILQEKIDNGEATDGEMLRILSAKKDLEKYTKAKEDNVLLIEDISDEVGHRYANVDITLKESADEFILYNDIDKNNNVVIRNCSAGETIHLYGETKIITSDYNHANLQNDFNFNFFRICNTYESSTNNIHTNKKADIVIDYKPIRKVGIVL